MPPVDSARERTDKHDLILDAAIEVFAEKGFHHARISDIARRAGVADGTIYLYFRNKDDVLLTIFEEKMGILIRGVRQALQGVADPLQKVRIFARYHFRQVEDHRALAEVLQIELRLSNKFLKEYRPEKLWEYLGVFADIVREGQETGAVRPDLDPFVLMWAFFGSLDELAMQWVLAKHRRDKFSLEATADTVADVFIRGMAGSGSIELHPVVPRTVVES
ncbi:MAG: TetR/AcrR family transcriptional regulator [Pseudomonadota bacterium]|nr:TetR/AcrR family transcriptional regulator [Pseudomonadota bacterium]